MRKHSITGLALALGLGLLVPSMASALSRMPTARSLVKPTKALIVKELNARVPSVMCVPPYTARNVKFTSKPLKANGGDLVRAVSWKATRGPGYMGGHEGTAKITASIAPACGVDIKLTNFKLKAFWPSPR